MKQLFLIFFAAANFLAAAVYAITPNQTDNFQDGTTQNWTSGSINTIQPTVLSGGFSGASDNFLRIVSNGSITAGGKLVFFNSIQWSGNYITANVVIISMRVRNSGTSALNLRLAFNGLAGWFVSTNPVNLPADGIWKVISFPIHPADLTGAGDANITLGDVTTLRILHNSTANFIGEPIVAQLDVDDITAVAITQADGENPGLTPIEYSLEQNYPNPFNPITTINYQIPKRGLVSIKVFNTMGKEVATLVNQYKNQGKYIVNFNASELSSGVYFYQIRVNDFVSCKKMVLTK
jgi:hypothetical protein